MNKTKTAKNHEPLVHISKRDSLPMYKSWAIRGLAILAALIVAGIITMLLTGENPITVFPCQKHCDNTGNNAFDRGKPNNGLHNNGKGCIRHK